MSASKKTLNYLSAVLFWFTGILFFVTGIWNLFSSLNAGIQVTDSVVALLFLALFAMVSVIYGLFLFQGARTGPATEKAPGILARLRPATVIGFLVYGAVPLLFVYLSADSREFHQKRQAAFDQIRPAVLEYIAEHGKVPGRLNLLVPEYLADIPAAAIFTEDARPARRVQYVAARKTARFYYKTAGLTGSGTCYDIVNDRYCGEK